jgi:hypothetical protein
MQNHERLRRALPTVTDTETQQDASMSVCFLEQKLWRQKLFHEANFSCRQTHNNQRKHQFVMRENQAGQRLTFIADDLNFNCVASKHFQPFCLNIYTLFSFFAAAAFMSRFIFQFNYFERCKVDGRIVFPFFLFTSFCRLISFSGDHFTFIALFVDRVELGEGEKSLCADFELTLLAKLSQNTINFANFHQHIAFFTSFFIIMACH